MGLSSGQTIPAPSHDKFKMEDRKRSLASDHDVANPPSKRQATMVNGAANRMDADKEKEIELYQKDAILRQMREYKRDKAELETRVNDLSKQSAYHDDHIRLIDAWFLQLLDEIRIQVNDLIPVTGTTNDVQPFKSSLLVDSSTIFEQHLTARSQKIKTVITELFAKTANPTAEVRELQERLSALLAAEKAHVVELQRITSSRDQLEVRLENASLRYLKAEKKLEKAKSAVVQKMEQKAIMKREDDSANATAALQKADGGQINGEVSSAMSAAAESARREAVAIAERRKVQVDQLEAENKRLMEEMTSAKVARTAPTDEEYAKTTLFSQLKTQHEDAIKRLNDLEATNIQLREEAQKLHSERTAHRTQLDDESNATNIESSGQLTRLESDIARLRHQRDELAAENAINKTSRQDSTRSAEAGAELISARQDRITALETELQRIRVKDGTAIGDADDGTPNPEATSLDTLSADDLRAKLLNLQKAESMLNKELASMEAAWRKSQALAARKVTEIAGWEEQIARSSAEKAKADQKYFAAMKAKETREGELRTLKAQNAKTSEIVTQLKDAESANRALSANLERQLAETKEALNAVSQQARSLQQKVGDGNVTAETLKTEIAELKKLLVQKDASVAGSASARRAAEVEVDELKARLDETKKSIEVLKKRAAGKDLVDSADDWRRVAICPVCNSNLRNTALKLCNHVFCDVCVSGLIANRSRKCPSCGKGFGVNDSMPIILA